MVEKKKKNHQAKRTILNFSTSYAIHITFSDTFNEIRHSTTIYTILKMANRGEFLAPLWP